MVPDLVFPPRDVEHALVVLAHEELPLQPDAHGHVAWAETELNVAPLLVLARIVVPRHDGHAVAQRQKRAAGLAERVRILEADGVGCPLGCED